MTKLALKIPDKVHPGGGVHSPPVVCQSGKRRYRSPNGKSFKCCVWEGLDSFFMVGFIVCLIVLGACLHYVGRPYMHTPDLSPATCTVHKVITPKDSGVAQAATQQGPPKGGKTENAQDKDHPPPPAPGMTGEQRGEFDEDHEPLPGSPHRPDGRSRSSHHRPGDHEDMEEGSHRGKRGSGSWDKDDDDHHGRKHHSKGEPVEGFDYPYKNGSMVCKDCYFNEVSRCNPEDKDYSSGKMCTISTFPCIKVLVSYDAKEEDSGDSDEDDGSEEDDEISERLEDHPREDKPPRDGMDQKSPPMDGARPPHMEEREEGDKEDMDGGKRHKRMAGKGRMPPPPPGHHGSPPMDGSMEDWLDEEEDLWDDWIGGHMSDENWREIKEFMNKEWTEEDWKEAMAWLEENFDTEDWTDEDWADKKEWIKEMKSKCNGGMPPVPILREAEWTEQDWQEIEEYAREEWREEDWPETAEWIKERFDTKHWTEEDWVEKKAQLMRMKTEGHGLEDWMKLKTEWDGEDKNTKRPPPTEFDKTKLKLEPGIALLHTDVDNMENFPQCSYSVCHSSETENAEQVVEWTSNWVEKQQSGEEFDCYYDPEDPTRAFVGRLYSTAEVVNAILWPSLFAIICFCALVGRRIYFGCATRQVGDSRATNYAVNDNAYNPEPTKEMDPEKDPASLGPHIETPRPLELSVASAPPDYKEVIAASGDRPVAIILPPTYSEANLHKAAKDELPICDA